MAYPAHESSAIVPIDGAFSGMSYAADVALSPEKDGVYEGLWSVQVLEKKHGYTDKAKEHGQVIGYKVVGE